MFAIFTRPFLRAKLYFPSPFFNCFYATGPKVSFSKYMQSEMSHKGSFVSRADECGVEVLFFNFWRDSLCTRKMASLTVKNEKLNNYIYKYL